MFLARMRGTEAAAIVYRGQIQAAVPILQVKKQAQKGLLAYPMSRKH